MTRTPTQTMATRCTHGRQAILDMDGIRRHVGGAWEPCEGQPPALEAADRLEAAGAGPLPTWLPARANAAQRIIETLDEHPWQPCPTDRPCAHGEPMP